MTQSDKHLMQQFLQNLPQDIPNVLLFAQQKQGRKVEIRLEVTGKYSQETPFIVELISKEGHLLMTPIDVKSPDFKASFNLPEEVKEGSYRLQVTYGNCVLDSTTFDVLDEASAQKMEAFDLGLEHKDEVNKAIEAGDYPRAFEEQKKVARYYSQTGDPELVVNSWESLADDLYKKFGLAEVFNQTDKSDTVLVNQDGLYWYGQVLKEIKKNYEKINDSANLERIREQIGTCQQAIASLPLSHVEPQPSTLNPLGLTPVEADPNILDKIASKNKKNPYRSPKN